MRHLKAIQILGAGAMACAVLALPNAALAQATRTYVSGVGDDANPCSRTAPCKTFAGAISKTAAGGEINVLDPGGFGAVTITKPLTIIADGDTAGVLVSGTNGIVIDAGPTDSVTIEGLDIDGLNPEPDPGLNGIDFMGGGSLTLKDDEIYDFSQDGVQIADGNPGSVYIEDSSIDDNLWAGVGAVDQGGAQQITVSNSDLTGNGCGIAIGPNFGSGGDCSSTPDGTTDALKASVLNNNIQGNTEAGIEADGSNASAEFYGNDITGNGTGIEADNGGTLTAYGFNTIFGNITADGTPTSTVSPLVGPAGPTGAIGPQGLQGASGASGAPGVPGTPGANGQTGDKGDAGLQGNTGNTGAKGDTGATGETGASGPAGPAGAPGKNGAVEVITCKTVTKQGKKTTQCSGQLSQGQCRSRQPAISSPPRSPGRARFTPAASCTLRAAGRRASWH